MNRLARLSTTYGILIVVSLTTFLLLEFYLTQPISPLAYVGISLMVVVVASILYFKRFEKLVNEIRNLVFAFGFAFLLFSLSVITINQFTNFNPYVVNKNIWYLNLTLYLVLLFIFSLNLVRHIWPSKTRYNLKNRNIWKFGLYIFVVSAVLLTSFLTEINSDTSFFSTYLVLLLILATANSDLSHKKIAYSLLLFTATITLAVVLWHINPLLQQMKLVFVLYFIFGLFILSAISKSKLFKVKSVQYIQLTAVFGGLLFVDFIISLPQNSSDIFVTIAQQSNVNISYMYILWGFLVSLIYAGTFKSELLKKVFILVTLTVFSGLATYVGVQLFLNLTNTENSLVFNILPVLVGFTTLISLYLNLLVNAQKLSIQSWAIYKSLFAVLVFGSIWFIVRSTNIVENSLIANSLILFLPVLCLTLIITWTSKGFTNSKSRFISKLSGWITKSTWRNINVVIIVMMYLFFLRPILLIIASDSNWQVQILENQEVIRNINIVLYYLGFAIYEAYEYPVPNVVIIDWILLTLLAAYFVYKLFSFVSRKEKPELDETKLDTVSLINLNKMEEQEDTWLTEFQRAHKDYREQGESFALVVIATLMLNRCKLNISQIKKYIEPVLSLQFKNNLISIGKKLSSNKEKRTYALQELNDRLKYSFESYTSASNSEITQSNSLESIKNEMTEYVSNGDIYKLVVSAVLLDYNYQLKRSGGVNIELFSSTGVIYDNLLNGSFLDKFLLNNFSMYRRSLILKATNYL